MVDSEFNTDDYKSSKISIGAIMKNSEMIRLAPSHLKTKDICKHAITKIPFLIGYVPD